MAGPSSGARPAAPLVVSARNPRYFTPAIGDHAGRAVYLTGSHIWNNLHDGMGPGAEAPEEPERFDYNAYLRFLTEHGHNFIRLWRWEQFRSQAAGGNYHLNMTPQPWVAHRAGHGQGRQAAVRPRAASTPAFFERLRERVVAAGEAGIYVGVMLFDGWALHLSPRAGPHRGPPVPRRQQRQRHRGDVDRRPAGAAARPAGRRRSRRRTSGKVVDTLHDLPNVLWEVANESSGDGSVDRGVRRVPGHGPSRRVGATPRQWQYWVIDVVKEHERRAATTRTRSG